MMTYENALQRAASMCSTSEHCLHEIREKLTKWNVSYADAERILDYLVDENYIDESRFCRAYTLDKLRYNHWGRIKITQMLRMMHLGKADIQYGMSEIPEEEYTHILEDLLASKSRSVKAKSTYERNGKLIRFALGRGFEMSLICKLLPEADEMEGMEYDESDD